MSVKRGKTYEQYELYRVEVKIKFALVKAFEQKCSNYGKTKKSALLDYMLKVCNWTMEDYERLDETREEVRIM